MRMTASWSGSNDPTAYKSVARRRAPDGELPSDPQQIDRYRSDAEAMQKAPVAVHHRSACSGVKALRNTSPAGRQAAKLCYRFGPLTPSARSANLIAGDGTKNGFPAPNKEPATNQKTRLDRKSPIQVRIVSLQRRVWCEPDFRGRGARCAKGLGEWTCVILEVLDRMGRICRLGACRGGLIRTATSGV
jgi:hypothetical protein